MPVDRSMRATGIRIVRARAFFPTLSPAARRLDSSRVFNDLRARRAIALGINREQYLKIVEGDDGIVPHNRLRGWVTLL